VLKKGREKMQCCRLVSGVLAPEEKKKKGGRELNEKKKPAYAVTLLAAWRGIEQNKGKGEGGGKGKKERKCACGVDAFLRPERKRKWGKEGGAPLSSFANHLIYLDIRVFDRGGGGESTMGEGGEKDSASFLFSALRSIWIGPEGGRGGKGRPRVKRRGD